MHCRTCRFWIDGECHRYPPERRGFVIVSGETWCGEYQEVLLCPAGERKREEDEVDRVLEAARRGKPRK